MPIIKGIPVLVLLNTETCAATFFLVLALLLIILIVIITAVSRVLPGRTETGQQVVQPIPKRQSLPPPDFVRPPVYALAPGPNLQPLDPDPLHPRRVLQPDVARHAAGVGPLLRDELQHRHQKVGNALGFLLLEVVLLLQDIRKRPVPQPVDVAELALAVEYLLRPLARQAQ